jgi:hypothetical protein
MSNTIRDASLETKLRVARALAAAPARPGANTDRDADVTTAALFAYALAAVSTPTASTPTASAPTVSTLAFVPFNFELGMTAAGNVTSDGGGALSRVGVAWNTTGAPGLADHVLSTAVPSTGVFSLSFTAGSAALLYARAFATNAAGTSFGSTLTATPELCLAAGTRVALAAGGDKAVEDVRYDDELLTWDFDAGAPAAARPLWIKVPQPAAAYNRLTFSDGRTLRTVGQHRLLNLEAGAFTYPMSADTPLGTTTVALGGGRPVLLAKEVVAEPTTSYNVIAARHMALFADGVLTSCRYSNAAPIDAATLRYDRGAAAPPPPRPRDARIPAPLWHGLRLDEQRRFDADESAAYVQRLLALALPQTGA